MEPERLTGDIPVWLDGTQRWVTGLTKRTTCDDVIYALLFSNSLHETDSTDSYAIFEKWREVERPLSARTKLLKVWNFWGQEQSNVQLTMRHVDDYFFPGESNLYNRSRRRHKRSSRLKSRHHTSHGRSYPLRRGCVECTRLKSLEQLVELVVCQERKIKDLHERIQHTDRLVDTHESRIHQHRVEHNGMDYVQNSYLNSHSSSSSSSIDSSVFTTIDLKKVKVIFPESSWQDLEDIMRMCDDIKEIEKRKVDEDAKLNQHLTEFDILTRDGANKEVMLLEKNAELDEIKDEMVSAVAAHITQEYNEKELDLKMAILDRQIQDKQQLMLDLHRQLINIEEMIVIEDDNGWVASTTSTPQNYTVPNSTHDGSLHNNQLPSQNDQLGVWQYHNQSGCNHRNFEQEQHHQQQHQHHQQQQQHFLPQQQQHFLAQQQQHFLPQQQQHFLAQQHQELHQQQQKKHKHDQSQSQNQTRTVVGKTTTSSALSHVLQRDRHTHFCRQSGEGDAAGYTNHHQNHVSEIESNINGPHPNKNWANHVAFVNSFGDMNQKHQETTLHSSSKNGDTPKIPKSKERPRLEERGQSSCTETPLVNTTNASNISIGSDSSNTINRYSNGYVDSNVHMLPTMHGDGDLSEKEKFEGKTWNWGITKLPAKNGFNASHNSGPVTQNHNLNAEQLGVELRSDTVVGNGSNARPVQSVISANFDGVRSHDIDQNLERTSIEVVPDTKHDYDDKAGSLNIKAYHNSGKLTPKETPAQLTNGSGTSDKYNDSNFGRGTQTKKMMPRIPRNKKNQNKEQTLTTKCSQPAHTKSSSNLKTQTISEKPTLSCESILRYDDSGYNSKTNINSSSSNSPSTSSGAKSHSFQENGVVPSIHTSFCITHPHKPSTLNDNSENNGNENLSSNRGALYHIISGKMNKSVSKLNNKPPVLRNGSLDNIVKPLNQYQKKPQSKDDTDAMNSHNSFYCSSTSSSSTTINAYLSSDDTCSSVSKLSSGDNCQKSSPNSQDTHVTTSNSHVTSAPMQYSSTNNNFYFNNSHGKAKLNDVPNLKDMEQIQHYKPPRAFDDSRKSSLTSQSSQPPKSPSSRRLGVNPHFCDINKESKKSPQLQSSNILANKRNITPSNSRFTDKSVSHSMPEANRNQLPYYAATSGEEFGNRTINFASLVGSPSNYESSSSRPSSDDKIDLKSILSKRQMDNTFSGEPRYLNQRGVAVNGLSNLRTSQGNNRSIVAKHKLEDSSNDSNSDTGLSSMHSDETANLETLV